VRSFEKDVNEEAKINQPTNKRTEQIYVYIYIYRERERERERQREMKKQIAI
jgi:hypothetical protein